MTTGDIRYHRAFRSTALPDEHDVLVYLPPGYWDSPNHRYPVLYLQDGQNVFDGETAFIHGQEWGVDDSAEAMIRQGELKPLIVVAIHNAGVNRIDEYTPTRDARTRRGGKAYLYGRMLVNDLKPFIDNEYRTLRDRRHTGLGGSSLGALVTLYLGLKHPTVFGKLAVMSPSVWWDNRAILKMVDGFDGHDRPSIWLDVGTEEGAAPRRTIRDARSLRDRLVALGWSLGHDLEYFEAIGADHSERSWARRVPAMLKFLFGGRKSG
ncbi:MAG: alpha/beta hydrolase-fold protein [Bryobacteraceae bacterium]|nr:alpha/beta hydrolase-fold protein [Bryobacteraceae bacterium]